MVRIGQELLSMLLKVVQFFNNLLDSSRADKLLIAVFVVAMLRQMGVNGHFIGYDPASNWAWFQPLEVISGIAMAILIGVALAYIARRWRKLAPNTWTEWAHWGFISIGMVLILICEIFYTALYAYAAQRATTVAITFTPAVNMLWNITVAGVLPLIAILIGIVSDDDISAAAVYDDTVLKEDGWLILIEMVKAGNTRVLPQELASRANISVELAQQIIKEGYEVGFLNNVIS